MKRTQRNSGSLQLHWNFLKLRMPEQNTSLLVANRFIYSKASAIQRSFPSSHLFFLNVVIKNTITYEWSTSIKFYLTHTEKTNSLRDAWHKYCDFTQTFCLSFYLFSKMECFSGNSKQCNVFCTYKFST